MTKTKPEFRVVQKDDLRPLADWLVAHSQDPAHHCLHTWAGESSLELAGKLANYMDDGEMCYIIAEHDGRPVGAFGSEFDRELGRGWLHGPHASARDRETIFKELFRHLSAELPAGIKRLDAYLNIENSSGRLFYQEQGFKEKGSLNYDFRLTPDRRVALSGKGSDLLSKEHAPSFKGLYDALFPNTYYSAERIVQMNGTSHQVLVDAVGEDVKGFAVVCVEDGGKNGELQFLGVHEDQRGRGSGRRLLLSATDWLFNEGRVSWINLNVNEELVQARKLYESIGFRLQFIGIGLNRNLEG